MSDKEASPAGDGEDGGPVLARNCTVDAVVAAILLVVGVVVIIEARRLGAGWTSDGPGAGYFPFYIGVIVCISSLGILWQALFSKSRDTGPFDHFALARK